MSKNFDPRTDFNKTKSSSVVVDTTTNNGQTLNETLEDLYKLKSEMNSIKAQLTVSSEQVTSSSTMLAESPVYDLVSQKYAINPIVANSKFDLSISQDSSNNSIISFNLEEVIKNLPKDYLAVSSDVSVRSYGNNSKILASSSSKKGNLTVIQGTKEPALVTGKINVKTPSGDLIMTKTYYVDKGLEYTSALTGTFEVVDNQANIESSLTLKEYNEILASNLSKVINTVSSISSRLEDLEKKVKEIT